MPVRPPVAAVGRLAAAPLNQARTLRRSSPVASVAGILLVVSTMACKAGPSPDDINRLIDQRLAERGLATVPVASASSAPSSSAPAALSSAASSPKPPPKEGDAVAASLALLAALDDLMKDYKPELPIVEPPLIEDKSDLLRCVTTDAKRSPEFQKAASKLKKMAEAAKKKADAAKEERRRAESEFYGARYQLAFHYDLDWPTRGKKHPVVYGCWLCEGPQQGTTCWQGHPADWSDDSESTCKTFVTSVMAYRKTWRVKVPAGAFTYAYSNADTPPQSPPEMMRRMESAGVKLPPRFTCRVEDVVPEGGAKIVRCASSRVPVSLRLTGDVKVLNAGDVASVPLAGTKRDPDGVLFKTRPMKDGGWVVDADGASLTVDAAATCPSMDEVLTALGGDSKK